MNKQQLEYIREVLETGKDWYEQGHEWLGDKLTEEHEFDMALTMIDRELEKRK